MYVLFADDNGLESYILSEKAMLQKKGEKPSAFIPLSFTLKGGKLGDVKYKEAGSESAAEAIKELSEIAPRVAEAIAFSEAVLAFPHAMKELLSILRKDGRSAVLELTLTDGRKAEIPLEKLAGSTELLKSVDWIKTALEHGGKPYIKVSETEKIRTDEVYEALLPPSFTVAVRGNRGLIGDIRTFTESALLPCLSRFDASVKLIDDGVREKERELIRIGGKERGRV